MWYHRQCRLIQKLWPPFQNITTPKMMSSPPPPPKSRCHKTLPSHLFPKQEPRMDERSNHTPHPCFHPSSRWPPTPAADALRIMAWATNPRSLAFPNWELRVGTPVPWSSRRFASPAAEWVSLPGSLRSSPAASRELSLRPPLQLSSAPRSNVAGRLLGVRKTSCGRLWCSRFDAL